jgi:hypothetical protein
LGAADLLPPVGLSFTSKPQSPSFFVAFIQAGEVENCVRETELVPGRYHVGTLAGALAFQDSPQKMI